jgi:hypothetical protein
MHTIRPRGQVKQESRFQYFLLQLWGGNFPFEQTDALLQNLAAESWGKAEAPRSRQSLEGQKGLAQT